MSNDEYIDRTMTRYVRRYGMYDAPAVSVTQTAVTTGGNSVSQTVHINNGARNKTRYARLIRWIKSWLS
ncbi:hypothetical protein vBRpoSV10_192 [Ruegeria phage vB_RpoS-V10]|nr:hypothetical protein vBRpoSV10_192 [Ruegeria phage vB_RpoS-V10]